MSSPIITLLTDFGAGSGYPAQMKGVLLAGAPEARLVDLSHEVTAYDVLGGALLLEACAPRFPVQAVHLAVVDPGVGTERRPICLVDAAGRRFVGPDNGLFTPFLEGGRVYLLAEGKVAPRPASATFHGRDLRRWRPGWPREASRRPWGRPSPTRCGWRGLWRAGRVRRWWGSAWRPMPSGT
jgi:S-adenosylmethionine hydrolase